MNKNHEKDAEKAEKTAFLTEIAKKSRKKVKKPENPLKNVFEGEESREITKIGDFFVGFPDLPLDENYFAAWASAALKVARRRAGLTQNELSRRSGIRQQAISAYEDETQVPNVGRWMVLMRTCAQVIVTAGAPEAG